MVNCSAYGCSNRSDRDTVKDQQKITYHKFPKDPELRLKWCRAVRRKNWVPSDSSVLCSTHFTDNCFNKFTINRRLNYNSVPTIFPAFPSYLQHQVVSGRKRNRSLMSEKTSNMIENVQDESNTLLNASNRENQAPTSLTSDFIPECSPSTSSAEAVSQSWKQMKSRTTSFSPDHKHHNTPSEVEHVRKSMQLTINRYKKKIKVLQQTTRRQTKRLATFKNIIKTLSDKNLVLEENLVNLENISIASKEILKRQVAKSKKRIPKAYSPQLKKFALTLHYYSPRAYQYIRDSFNTCLPHAKTLSRWYACINGKPGFTTEAFAAIKVMAEASDVSLLCALLMDEVAIRKHVEYDGKEMVGYIDMGTGIDTDTRDLATNALVFMLVCINGGWKIPVGYFLVNGVTSEQRCNLVKQCLTFANEANVRVVSLTFDGCPSNITMATKLGCCFNTSRELVTSFKHPSTSELVYVYFDICHMIKLIRNALGDKGVLVDEHNNLILWDFFKALNELQENEGLHLGNKVTALHIYFAKQKMKVRLATQVFSESVANAMKFCKEELNLPQFAECEATINFIGIFNKLFDVFNSKHLKQCNFKKPITHSNFEAIFAYLEKAAHYIYNLKVSRTSNELIINSNRKTGFLGFLVCINSLRHNMYTDVCQENKLIFYLPTYKISQDHLELFFAVIRSHLGKNNNPTCKQFISAYKKVLLHLELKAHDRGNCIPLEDISILHCKTVTAVERINYTTRDNSVLDVNEESIHIEEESDHQYLASLQELSELSKNIVSYIAGFVVRHLYKVVKCEMCLIVLCDAQNREMCRLIEIKDRGGLIFPSADVIDICRSSEKCIKQALAESGGKHLLKRFSKEKLSTSILQHYINKKIFVKLIEHTLDNDGLDNHIILLIKAIADKYLDVRLRYIARRAIDKSKSERHHFTKLILFRGQ